MELYSPNANELNNLAEDLEVRLTQLKQIHQMILDAQNMFAEREPEPLEVYIPAGVIEDLYTQMEKILQKIIAKYDGEDVTGASWHQDLLQLAQKTTHKRRPLLSPQTAQHLKQYLGLRHVIRGEYGFMLKWEKLRQPLQESEQMLDEFIQDLNQFVSFLRMSAEDLNRFS